MRFNVYKGCPLTNKFIEIFFILTIVLLPYDAIKFMSSTYKPISIFPLLLLFILLLPKIFYRKMQKHHWFLIAFYFFSNIVSYFLAFANSINFEFCIDYSITSTLGIMIFLTTNYIFSLNRNNSHYEEWFPKIIAISYIFPIIIALLDGLSIYGLLPSNMSITIHRIFGGSNDRRICGTSFEASWVSMHLLFSFFAYLYCIKKNMKSKLCKIMIIIDSIVFVFLFSMQGYITVALIVLSMFLIKCFKRINYKTFLYPIIVILFLFIMMKLFSHINSNLYFIARLRNLSINYLLYNDLSAFVRILNPLIALMMGFKNGLLGVGGGQYPIYYGEYINNYFPWGLEFYGGNNEVVNSIITNTASAKSLYFRIVGETGIFSILFFAFLFMTIKSKTKNKYLILWLVCVLMLMIQFDSLCYFPFYMFLAYYDNLKRRKV